MMHLRGICFAPHHSTSTLVRGFSDTSTAVKRDVTPSVVAVHDGLADELKIVDGRDDIELFFSDTNLKS
jgi:hypothetical protein